MTTESSIDDNLKDNSESFDNSGVEDDEEEFVIHMRFGAGEYFVGKDPKDIHLLGFDDNKCHVRIGDSIYAGARDSAINTSVIAKYDKETLNFDELQVCQSRMLMERLFIKPKNAQQSSNDQQMSNEDDKDKDNQTKMVTDS